MKTTFLLLIAPFFLFSGMQNRKQSSTPDRNWSGAKNIADVNAASPGVKIADTRIVEGNAGQRVIEVVVSISQVSSGSVTIAYSTRNGTALADADYVPIKGSITFAPGDMIKRIKVSIIGEVVCEQDEKFEILLSDASGATLDGNAGTVTIVNDDCIGNSPGSGNLSRNLSVYEVRFTHTGYTSLFTGPSECGIRANGKVILTGLLSGAENVGDDDDIAYKGVLQMDIDIDMCSAMRLPNGEDKLCAMTVSGSGPVEAELEIYYDQRGGYIKIEHKSGLFLKNIFGTCDQAQIDEERDMIPNKTIVSIFNGRDLPMLTNRTLRIGRYVETDGGNETVVEVLRKIR